MRLFSFLLLFAFSSCYHAPRDCGNFKNGTFEIEALSGTELLTTTIVRNDTMEIDYFRDKIDTSSVRWINDCEYIVQKLNPKNRAEEKAIHIKILTTNENSYTFEFKEVGKKTTRKATAKKVR